MQIFWLGCGWLGDIFLANYFKYCDDIAVTNTHHKKYPVDIKNNNRFSQYLFNGNQDYLPDIVGNYKNIVISIPPSGGKNNPSLRENYSDLIKKIAKDLVFKVNPNAKIIFISSTGVYPQKSGVYDEKSFLDQQNPISKAENIWREYLPFSIFIRLGGLYGQNRYPLPKATYNKIVNMVSGDNAVCAIFNLLQKDFSGKIFNLVEPNYPLASEFFAQMAKKKRTSLPIILSGAVANRIIVANKICNECGFIYR